MKNAAAAGTIRLGDLTVNRLGFGAMRLCGPYAWGRRRKHDNERRVLGRVLELGINFIDTADSYGPEANETLLAETLYPYPWRGQRGRGSIEACARRPQRFGVNPALQ